MYINAIASPDLICPDYRGSVRIIEVTLYYAKYSFCNMLRFYAK